MDGDSTLDDAARVVQACWRKHRAQRSLEQLTSRDAIVRLRSIFLDQRARAAGAEESPLYTLQAMSSRDALRYRDDTHALDRTRAPPASCQQ